MGGLGAALPPPDGNRLLSDRHRGRRRSTQARLHSHAARLREDWAIHISIAAAAYHAAGGRHCGREARVQGERQDRTARRVRRGRRHIQGCLPGPVHRAGDRNRIKVRGWRRDRYRCRGHRGQVKAVGHRELEGKGKIQSRPTLQQIGAVKVVVGDVVTAVGKPGSTGPEVWVHW